MVCDQGEAPHSRLVLTSTPVKPQRRVGIISRVSAGMTVLRQVWSLSQEDVVQSFRKLFPYEWLVGFAFPFIEDLINTDVFMGYLWTVGPHGCAPSSQTPPKDGRGTASRSLESQGGSATHPVVWVVDGRAFRPGTTPPAGSYAGGSCATAG